MNRNYLNFSKTKKNNFIFKDSSLNLFKKKNMGGLRTKSIIKKNLYSRPLISIIIATHNSEKYLEQCLNSIFKQSYKRKCTN